MKRYSVIQAPTVIGLRDHLDDLIKQGFGTSIVLIADPELVEWQTVTGFIYGGEDNAVKLYCDDDE